MPRRIARSAHRVVVRERHEGDSGRMNTALHRERHSWNSGTLYLLADQPHGPVAERSRRCEQDRVHTVFEELLRDFGGSLPYEQVRGVDRTHKREMAVVQLTDNPFTLKTSQGPQRKDGVKIHTFIGAVVGVGPGEGRGVRRDLSVRAIAFRIVYVEADLVRQVYAAGSDEGEAALGERFSRTGER